MTRCSVWETAVCAISLSLKQLTTPSSGGQGYCRPPGMNAALTIPSRIPSEYRWGGGWTCLKVSTTCFPRGCWVTDQWVLCLYVDSLQDGVSGPPSSSLMDLAQCQCSVSVETHTLCVFHTFSESPRRSLILRLFHRRSSFSLKVEVQPLRESAHSPLTLQSSCGTSAVASALYFF